MIEPSFHSYAELFERTRRHPWVTLTPQSPTLTGYARDGALAWFVDGPRGQWGGTFGDSTAALALVTDLHLQGALDAVREVHFARTPIERLGQFRPVQHNDWHVLWTGRQPPPVPREDDVVRLGPQDDADIQSILDDALPGSHNRPGEPRIRGWYGIRDGGRLVAVGADRSRPATMGYVVAVAVTPSLQGQGLGGAVTAAITRRLLREEALVGLGVLTSNERAIRLYRRLGFTDGIELTSIRFPD